MKTLPLILAIVSIGAVVSPEAQEAAVGTHVLIKTLQSELDYSMKHLTTADGMKPYFMAYTLTDVRSVYVAAVLGTVTRNTVFHHRVLDVDVRVGDYQLDNTHRIRGESVDFDPTEYLGQTPVEVPLEDDPTAIRNALWLGTDHAFKSAVKRYQRVLNNLKTKVEEEDKSADFSKEEPHKHSRPEVRARVDVKRWADRLCHIANLARKYPLIYYAEVSLWVTAKNRYMVTSEGTEVQDGQKFLRVTGSAMTRAEDGMNLYKSFEFNAASEDRLPGDEEIEGAFRRVIEQTLALREAELVEPYTGPAILVNRAAAVFFHEIFGHRIEGHRQKDVEEGQTFTKQVNKSILPEFLSIHDNPSLVRFGDQDLWGWYEYDDEGVPARDVTLVEQGVLKTFLLGRSPVKGFTRSNGHGRCAPGNRVVSRMGNTLVTSSTTAPFEKLREMLMEECKKQGKPFGLLFEDISGGYTSTRSDDAQVFKVLPIVVYKVFADGRPDQLVRGADIVGTPLTCFSKIRCTGDDPAVFNGFCRAESGSVPVAAVSPSILVTQIEIERRSREQDRPPILVPPIALSRGEAKKSEGGTTR